MKSNFTGFVLIGGKSSRMGADKYALKIDGKTFLERAVSALNPICESVKIVLNQTQNIETNLPIIRDIYENRGAPGGIHAALKNCETEFAIISAVDLPFVTTEAIEKLIEFANKYNAVVPLQKNGRPQPLCAIYRVDDCLPKLEKLLEANNFASVKDFLDLIAVKYIDAEDLSADKDLLLNINYPADFAESSE